MTDTAPLPQPSPEVSFLRDYCMALLRHYSCMSVEIGRLPSLLGREFFRARVRHYHKYSFENLVLFVIDVERCLDRLAPFDRELIAHVVLEEYTQEEAARLMQVHRGTVLRRLPEALDALSEMFLAGGLLPRLCYCRPQPPADRESGAPDMDVQAAAETAYPACDHSHDHSDELALETCQAPCSVNFSLSSCSQTQNNSVHHATFTPSNVLY